MLSKLKKALGETQLGLEWRTNRLLRWSTNQPAALVLSQPGRFAKAPAERTFTGKSGVSLPVLSNFRYAMAPALSHLPPFRFLADLDREGMLTDAEQQAYRRAMGTRALSVPYEEVLILVKGLLARFPDRVAPELRGDPGRAELIPTQTALDTRLENEIAHLRARLKRVETFATPIPSGARVLEVGYTDAVSLFAWERLGYAVTGIDNAYDGTSATPTLHTQLADRLGARAKFEFGDITKHTQLEPNSFDIIYSVSVLEHISDIAAAFREMWRVLKPGGLMVHGWNPYFSPNGGHPWGLMDCPWGHLRLPTSDMDQYLDELRPLEAKLFRPWVWNTLDRKTTLGRMQATVMAADFRLLLWDQVPDSPDVLGDITPELFAECHAQYPDITLADLTTRDGLMVARKH